MKNYNHIGDLEKTVCPTVNCEQFTIENHIEMKLVHDGEQSASNAIYDFKFVLFAKPAGGKSDYGAILDGEPKTDVTAYKVEKGEAVEL